MLIKLCIKEGIKPICTVRRSEQVTLLKTEHSVEHVYNQCDADFDAQMSAVCKELNATVCLECIAGGVVNQMLGFMGFNSTVVLYGYLSEEPVHSINALTLLSKNQAIEGFLLGFYLKKLSPEQMQGFVMQVMELCTQDLKTEVHKRFGLHQIKEAVDFY